MHMRRMLGALASACLLAGCASAPPPPVDSALSTGHAAPVPRTSAPPSSSSSPLPSARRTTPPARSSSRPRQAGKPPSRTQSSMKHSSSAPATKTSTSAKPAAGGTVHAIGDSVMIDAQPNLVGRVPGITIDAQVSRQVDSGLTALRALHDQGRLAAVTVFGLGTNGPFTAEQIGQAIDLTAGHRLVIVTSHCPYCTWTDTNNADIRRLCTSGAHCAVADFEAEADKHPEWFTGDGVHMAVGGAGADGYARAVAAASG